MPTRAQQSFTRPVVLAVAEGATTPDPGTTGALVFSSTTNGWMRWTGTEWTGLVGSRTIQDAVDFGCRVGSYGEVGLASATFYADWVSAGQVLTCTIATDMATADHDVEDAVVEGITAYAHNIVPGVSVDVTATAPHGTWGQYVINVSG